MPLGFLALHRGGLVGRRIVVLLLGQNLAAEDRNQHAVLAKTRHDEIEMRRGVVETVQVQRQCGLAVVVGDALRQDLRMRRPMQQYLDGTEHLVIRGVQHGSIIAVALDQVLDARFKYTDHDLVVHLK